MIIFCIFYIFWAETTQSGLFWQYKSYCQNGDFHGSNWTAIFIFIIVVGAVYLFILFYFWYLWMELYSRHIHSNKHIKLYKCCLTYSNVLINTHTRIYYIRKRESLSIMVWELFLLEEYKARTTLVQISFIIIILNYTLSEQCIPPPHLPHLFDSITGCILF